MEVQSEKRVQIVKMRLKAPGGCKPPERARELGLWDRVIPSRAHRSGLAKWTLENRVRPTFQSPGLSLDPKNSGLIPPHGYRPILLS